MQIRGHTSRKKPLSLLFFKKMVSLYCIVWKNFKLCGPFCRPNQQRANMQYSTVTIISTISATDYAGSWATAQNSNIFSHAGTSSCNLCSLADLFKECDSAATKATAGHSGPVHALHLHEQRLFTSQICTLSSWALPLSGTALSHAERCPYKSLGKRWVTTDI